MWNGLATEITQLISLSQLKNFQVVVIVSIFVRVYPGVTP